MMLLAKGRSPLALNAMGEAFARGEPPSDQPIQPSQGVAGGAENICLAPNMQSQSPIRTNPKSG